MNFKFKLVENNLEEGFRGDTTLREYICNLLNYFCKSNLNYLDYVIHHINGDHADYNANNIALLPKATPSSNPNTSIHNICKNRHIDMNLNNSKYIEVLHSFKAVSVIDSLILGTIKIF